MGGNEDKSPEKRVDEQVVAGQRVSEVQQHASEGARAEADYPAAHGVNIGVAGSEAGEGDDDVPAVGADDDVQRVDGHGPDLPVGKAPNRTRLREARSAMVINASTVMTRSRRRTTRSMSRAHISMEHKA